MAILLDGVNVDVQRVLCRNDFYKRMTSQANHRFGRTFTGRKSERATKSEAD
ncbi:MAG: hypothetical protein IPP88_02550 [Betaproteobacteria bacterium]|nr:hypothetical protein [Betaproteobacteria bacterium]